MLHVSNCFKEVIGANCVNFGCQVVSMLSNYEFLKSKHQVPIEEPMVLLLSYKKLISLMDWITICEK